MRKGAIVKRALIALLVTAVVASLAPQASAAPDMEIPVTFSLGLTVPGKYWFKYALFDRDGTNSQDPGTEVWSENMDTLGPKRLIKTKTQRHMLGSIGSPMGSLNPGNFTQQLWAQAFRWKDGAWVSCSRRVKLIAQPYALASSLAEDADALDGRDSSSFANASHTHGAGALGCYVKRVDMTLTAGQWNWSYVNCDGSDRAISCGSYTPYSNTLTTHCGYYTSTPNGSSPPASCLVAWRNDSGGTVTVNGFATCCRP